MTWQPSPLDDALVIVTEIKLRSELLKERLLPIEAKADSTSLRSYVDRVRNLLQALEGCASSLESGGR